MKFHQAWLLIACLAAAPAHAAVIGIVEAGGGAVIELHDTAGACVGGALSAVYRQALPSQVTVPGCWVMGQTSMMVAFMDGDAVHIPAAAVRKPTPA